MSTIRFQSSERPVQCLEVELDSRDHDRVRFSIHNSNRGMAVDITIEELKTLQVFIGEFLGKYSRGSGKINRTILGVDLDGQPLIE